MSSTTKTAADTTGTNATLRADLVLRGGVVYDGTGVGPLRADVALQGDRISAVGLLPQIPGAQELDVSGLAVAPGFIDVHTHDDFAVVVHPDMAFKTLGGVTTCIVGNCGMGAAPFDLAWRIGRAFHPGHELAGWEGYAGYAKRLTDAPAAVNVGILVGLEHCAARPCMERRATDSEMRHMRRGARRPRCRRSVGRRADYEPSRWATSDELVALASEMADVGGIYATHMRDEGEGLLDSVREAIAIGERGGVAVQISHHKASGRAAWGLVRDSLRLIDEARARGVDVSADQYPYTAGSTVLSAVVSAIALAEGGSGGLGSISPDDVVIASCVQRKEWEGKSIATLVAAMGVPLADGVARILDAEPGATIIAHTMCEDDVHTVMRHPSTMIGSDGLPTLAGKPHPRLFGTFARVLGRYSRELGVLSMAEAVHRMTGMPATRFGLADRGVVRAGALADLVVFDPATVIDRGTYETPAVSPAGIPHVLVNGSFVVRDAAATDLRPGRVLRRRSAH